MSKRISSVDELGMLEQLTEYRGISILVVGQSALSGKTYFIMNSLWPLFRDTGHYTILFAKNAQNPLYDPIKTDAHSVVMWDYNPNMLKAVEYIQRATNNKYPALFIFDDVLSLRKTDIKELVLSLRNSRISTIMAVQSITMVSPDVRANFSYTFSGHYNKTQALRALHKYLSDQTLSQDDYIDAYRANIGKYDWLITDPDQHSFILKTENT